MFSARLPGDLRTNRFAATLAQLRADGAPLIDLTESNPTRAGFAYPPALMRSLADPAGLLYEPAPLGLPTARRAAADELSRRGTDIPASHVAITSSTSEAYSLLFKVLCDAGDEVLVPRPSYPLFEHLTRFDAVTPAGYRLEYDGRWSIDLESVKEGLSATTRAILLVSPNNPTGSLLRESDARALASICAERGVAIIADEVFGDYTFEVPADCRRTMAGIPDALVFVLGGLSKSVGLPQVKLAWIGVTGPETLVNAALARLEVVADAYLSVSAASQHAAGILLTEGADIRRQIRERLSANLRELDAQIARHPACSLLRPEGGWYAVLRVPATISEEDQVLTLLERERVVVYPGYFFDFPDEARLVVSLLPETRAFRDGLSRVLARASAI